jgi:hypothetical protein
MAAPAIADTRAYWLEKPGGTRVTRLYRRAQTPLIFAGRALEKLDVLGGWTLARVDTDGVRSDGCQGSPARQPTTSSGTSPSAIPPVAWMANCVR